MILTLKGAKSYDPINTKEALDKIQHPFLITNSQQPRNRWEILQPDKRHL